MDSKAIITPDVTRRHSSTSPSPEYSQNDRTTASTSYSSVSTTARKGFIQSTFEVISNIFLKMFCCRPRSRSKESSNTEVDDDEQSTSCAPREIIPETFTISNDVLKQQVDSQITPAIMKPQAIIPPSLGSLFGQSVEEKDKKS